jgi:hypothetical protein
MAEEMREPIRISIDRDGACTQFFDGVNIQGIRVFPACKYADCGARTLSPVELNEAVEIWMNRAPTKGPVWDNPNAALAEKDAEIARLNNIWNAHHSKCDERFSIVSREHDNTVVLVQKLKDRIADLEKTAETHETATEALIKELHQKQIALADLQDLVNPQRRSCLTCENTECDILIGADQTCWTQAQKKEPELFICPAHGVSEMCPTCHHSKPHEHTGENCTFDWVRCKKCIPYKEPVNVKGDLVNSLQEEGKSPIQHLQDRVLELEQHQGRDRADLMEKIGRSDATIKDLAVESQRAVDDIETEIRTLTGRQDLTRDKVKELEDNTSRELSQAFAEVSRALSERKQSADVARDVSNAQAHEILKMQDQIKGLEHRLGLVQDRIAEIEKNPLIVTYDHRPRSFVTSSPLCEGKTSFVSSAPSVEGKPKSRLKTDRTKKVKDS